MDDDILFLAILDGELEWRGLSMGQTCAETQEWIPKFCAPFVQSTASTLKLFHLAGMVLPNYDSSSKHETTSAAASPAIASLLFDPLLRAVGPALQLDEVQLSCHNVVVENE